MIAPALAAAAMVLAQPLDDLAIVRPAASGRASSAHPEAWSNADNKWIKPGETFTMADIDGPGCIRHIWLTFADAAPSWISKVGSAAPDEIVLRMYWDDQAAPAVECPLGDFFAAGFGRRAPVNSTPIQVQGGDSYNCFWPMPFRSRARITVTNESERPLAAFYYQVDFTHEPVPDDAGYFCAAYRQEFPTRRGDDYLIADIRAPMGGHYVGTVLSVRSRSPQWFGEGDEVLSIDGEASPSMRGTGTEDYFLNAWGMEKGTYPAFGVSWLDGEWLGDLGNKGTMYRWHLADPIRFGRSLRFTLEHKGWMSADETTTGRVEGHVERDDDFASIAFWYQRGEPGPRDPLPPAGERRLPSIDHAIEGAAMLPLASTEGGEASLQPGGFWTGDGQVFFDAQGVGSWIELPFDVPFLQRRRLVVAMTRSYDYGVYRILLDGEEVSPPADFFSPEIDVREVQLGDRELAPGRHILRLECTGSNPNSTGFKLGIDAVRLRERWNVKRPPLGP